MLTNNCLEKASKSETHDVVALKQNDKQAQQTDIIKDSTHKADLIEKASQEQLKVVERVD